MKKILWFVYLLMALPAWSQIQDDSTKLVYDAKTTLVTTEEHIFRRDSSYVRVDTSVVNFHRFTEREKSNWLLQNLGNVGTASQPIFHTAPDQVGRTSGFHAYDVYYQYPSKFQYYDTKSPYSNMHFVIGGQGRTHTHIDFTQNIKTNWNLGFQVDNITSDKQLGFTGRGDREVVTWQYNFFTHYVTPNKKYQLIFNFNRMNTEVSALGGAAPTGDESDSLFQYRNSNTQLQEAEGRDFRYHLHLLHDYKLNDLVTVFHEVDFYNHQAFYTDQLSDTPPQPDSLFYRQFWQGDVKDTVIVGEDTVFYSPYTRISSDTTNESSTFREISNRAGVKGQFGKFFYALYYKRRDLKFIYPYTFGDRVLTENYGGFQLYFPFNEKYNVRASGEYLLGGGYFLEGKLSSKFLDARYKRISREPNFLESQYAGNHSFWNADFKPEAWDEIEGTVHLPLEGFDLNAGLYIARIGNYIYFNERSEPVQVNEGLEFIRPRVDFSLRFLRRFYLDGLVIYNISAGNTDNFVRMPDWHMSGSLYYMNILFGGNLQLQVGLDSYWQSEYLADGYNPVIQQFYLQNDFPVAGYWVADIFLNLKINKVRIVAKLEHVNQGLQGPGYFITPYYPGVPRVFDFGVSWQFYD